MCLAIPGKIVKINKDNALVDYITEKRTGKIVQGSYNVGDYVFIQGGLVIEKIPKEQAESWLKLFQKK